MLVLSRIEGEEIVLDVPGFEPIVISVIRFQPTRRGRAARIGVQADRRIAVNRREVYDAIQREKELQHGD